MADIKRPTIYEYPRSAFSSASGRVIRRSREDWPSRAREPTLPKWRITVIRKKREYLATVAAARA